MESSAKRDSNPNAATMDARDRASRHSPTLDRGVQAQIGDKLRAMYGELAEQPVPDRLTAILARLGASGAGTQS